MKLEKGDVHVWQVSLDEPVIEFEKLNNSLSPDEQKRAKQFVFDKDREYFIVARGILRHILSRYLGLSAGELEFAYGEHGKPFLINQKNATSLEFNVSHSNGLALYAVTLNRPVGIDVELLSREVDGIGLAKRFFAHREFQELSSLPKHLQQQCFFNYWTLKEALVKAMGNGLFLSLDQFVVSCLPNKSAKLLEIQGSVDKAAEWTICPLVCQLGLKGNYLGAIAVSGKINLPSMYFLH